MVSSHIASSYFLKSVASVVPSKYCSRGGSVDAAFGCTGHESSMSSSHLEQLASHLGFWSKAPTRWHSTEALDDDLSAVRITSCYIGQSTELLDKLDEPGIELNNNDGPLLAIETDTERKVWSHENGQWEVMSSQLPSTCPARCSCFCTVSDGLLVIGGWIRDSGMVSRQCFHFSIATRRWRRLKDMPTARKWASAAVASNKIFVFGGRGCLRGLEKVRANAEFELDVCEVLDLSRGDWSTATSLPDPLFQPLVASLAGCIYILPQGDITHKTPFLRYNPSRDAYSKTGRFPSSMGNTWGSRLLSVADKLVLLPSTSGRALQYDPNAMQWTEIPLATWSYGWLHGFSAVERSGNILVCGGSSKDRKDEKHTLMEDFDCQAQRWRRLNARLPFKYDKSSTFVASVSECRILHLDTGSRPMQLVTNL